jgi:hypothetical protein
MRPKNLFPLLALTLLLSMLQFAPASAQVGAAVVDITRFEGRWEGGIVLAKGVSEGDLVLQFFANPDGKLVGLASLPILNIEDHPLAKVKVEGNQVSFIYEDETGSSRVKGTLSADGNRIEGEMQEKDKSMPIYLKRKAAPVLSQQLGVLSPDGRELREQFNRDAGHVRLLVMLSPTCHKCLAQARLTERYLMEQVDDPQLRLYVVWGPMQKDETEEQAEKATLNLDDSRVLHYWTPDQELVRAFSRPLNLTSPAWSIFFFFPADAQWTDELPPFSYYMHKNWNGKLPEDRDYDGEKLAQKVREMLAVR